MNSRQKFQPGDHVTVKSRDVEFVGVVQSVFPPDGIQKHEHQYSLAGAMHFYSESQLKPYVKQNALDRHADKLRQEFLDLIGYEDG